jgi:hypothetical protein
MPVCHDQHWWLVVANMRDKRFDILSSLNFRVSEGDISSYIVSILVFILI